MVARPYLQPGRGRITQQGEDTLVSLTDGSRLLLKGVDADDLSSTVDFFVYGYEPTLG